MRSYSPARAGPALVKTPSARQSAQRRRLGAMATIAALALASGLIGYFTTGGDATMSPRTGPFSYFPAK